MTCSSLTYTFWPQPTAQYGQTDLTTRSASAVRGASAAERADRAAAPSAARSPPRSWRSTGQASRSPRRSIPALLQATVLGWTACLFPTEDDRTPAGRASVTEKGRRLALAGDLPHGGLPCAGGPLLLQPAPSNFTRPHGPWRLGSPPASRHIPGRGVPDLHTLPVFSLGALVFSVFPGTRVF